MKVVIVKKATKYFERLSKSTKRRINEALIGLGNEPPQGDIKKIHVLVDEPIYIETDLTDEEHTLIAEGVEHYREHPTDFVPLESLL